MTPRKSRRKRAGVRPLVIAKQGYFYAGGRYADVDGKRYRTGQMYVEFQVPHQRRHRWPIVMWPGLDQSGTNFNGTPDGREGWAQYFLRQGYAVYVVDQPGRGRSPYHNGIYGPQHGHDAARVENRFTATKRARLWPQAHRQTQWPGRGTAGDPVFDQFYASQLPSLSDLSQMQQLNRDAGAALLDRIGPAILLTHSQSGAYGWLVADARPKLVRAIVAAEPYGPPAYDGPAGRDGVLTKPWGLTREPLRYSPAVKTADELVFVQQAQPDGEGLMRCWLQQAPARKLVNLARIPVLILTGEASYHAPYDHCTALYLEQAGVKTTFIRLADIGIRGNGHMLMLEKNSQRIAAVIAQWLSRNVPRKR